jgi:hypothetical protein
LTGETVNTRWDIYGQYRAFWLRGWVPAISKPCAVRGVNHKITFVQKCGAWIAKDATDSPSCEDLCRDSAILAIVSFSHDDADATPVATSQHRNSRVCCGVSGSLNQNLFGFWGVSINVAHFCWSDDR